MSIWPPRVAPSPCIYHKCKMQVRSTENANAMSNYNPNDRFKKHLKRKSSNRCIQLVETLPSSSINDQNFETESCPVPSTSNPFKISSPLKKRRRIQVSFADSEENARDPFDANVLKHKVIDGGSFPTTLSQECRNGEPGRVRTNFERFKSFDTGLVKQVHAVDFSHLMDSSDAIKSENKEEFEESSELPLDLRMGTKLRVVSQTAFPWMATRKTTGIVAVRIPASDRYDGMKHFNQLFCSGNEDPTVADPSSILSLLEAATMYWQFPVIPGMSLFPRITSELKNINRVPLAPLAVKTMSNQWVECCEQLFMSYKKGERENFYVASSVFNVLFTKTAVSDDFDLSEESQSCFRSFNGQSLIALVSHTSSATREHLRNQGVDYEVIGAKTIKRVSSLPTLDQNSCSTFDYLDLKENSMTGCPEEKEDNLEDKLEGNEAASSDENDSPTKANQEFLKNIGVSPRNVLKSSSRRKLRAQVADRDGISCLLVKGSAVQSLYNLLMSSDIVLEKTGPYTKIPPTFIATSPFLYGQLLSLNKSSQVFNKVNSKTTEYVLELDGGPILPHCAKLITKFLKKNNICEKGATINVSDRHSSNGMNEWTDRAENWNIVQVFPDCIKVKKI